MEDEYITVRRSKLLELRQAMEEYRFVVDKLKKDIERLKRFRQKGC